jgi:hypothetical protein
VAAGASAGRTFAPVYSGPSSGPKTTIFVHLEGNIRAVNQRNAPRQLFAFWRYSGAKTVLQGKTYLIVVR